MSSQTTELAYIPLSLKPRVVASGKGLLAFAMSVYQLWYVVLLDISLQTTWSKPTSLFNIDPFNNSLNLFFHAGFLGLAIGYTMIALRSAVTGYAPTKGTVTYRSFGAHYPDATTAGHVNVTEDSPVAPVALVASRSLEGDYVDGGYREESTSADGAYTENILSQGRTREVSSMGELPLEEALCNADQDTQQSGTTRALIACPVHSGAREASTAQAPHEIAQIRRSLRFLISFFGQLTVSAVLIVGSTIKQCLVPLRNQLKAFVAFLGTRTRGTRLTWDEELKDHPIFQDVVKHDLDVVKYELKKEINNAIKSLDPDYPEVNVLERDEETKRYVHVALSSECYSDLEAELLAYHSIVRDIQADPEHTPHIPLEKLRPVYGRVIPAYKEKGFLGEHLEADKDNRWIWALAPHLYLRDGQLIFIFHSAECEEKASRLTDEPQARRECLEREAWLWREGAYTAMSIRPDLKRGEYALRRHLEVCDRLGWHETAKAVVHQYCLRMDRLAPGARLRSDTLTLIEKVTTPPQKVNDDADDNIKKVTSSR